MKTEKMKVLLYLKKSGLDKSGKAPIMGRITIGRSIAQFSCKLSCNPDLWNPRESRMDGKSREAVEVNGKLENLLLSIQSAYQSLITKGCPFDATDVKEQFQGSIQARCMLIERLDMLIKEKEIHVGVDIKKESLSSYHSTRNHLQKFVQRKYKVSDMAFSQLTEDFIYEFRQYYLGVCGFQESSFFAVASHLKTVCRLAYREGIADTLMFDKAHIERGDKKAPKALDKEALEKLKALRFDDLEEEMETARDIFLFACYTGAAYCDLMELNKSHLVRDDEGNLWLKFNRQKTGVLCRIKLLPEAISLIERFHSDERETQLPYIKYKNYQTCLKALRLRAGIPFPFTTHTARHTFATLITLEQGVPIETVSKMLGHTNVSMTERYAKVTPQKLFEEFGRFLSFTEDLQLAI
ncbi:site-specific integrase [Prevotella falsenii]|uniref:site-specific integrase n=1 Tax=Prevotella falsenii TaxID=515414 RepID=UPI000468FFE0|nr:site-specific integrase [Prevotella falsenii]